MVNGKGVIGNGSVNGAGHAMGWKRKRNESHQAEISAVVLWYQIVVYIFVGSAL